MQKRPHSEIDVCNLDYLQTQKDAIEPLLLRFEATLCIRTMSLILANYDQIVQFRVDNIFCSNQGINQVRAKMSWVLLHSKSFDLALGWARISRMGSRETIVPVC